MRKHILITVAVLAAGAVIAQIHVETLSYQPIVRVEMPDGVSYTAVLDSTPERPACGIASRKFITPLKADCPECRIVYARCQREGQAPPAVAELLEKGEAHSLVSMPGVSITIEGTRDAARRSCEFIAESVQRLGVESARCESTTPRVPKT